MSSNYPTPGADPVLTGDLAEVTYHCHRCHEDFTFSVVMGHTPPPKMPHTGCPSAAAVPGPTGKERNR